MNPSERLTLALQLADQINADPLLAKDIEMWLNGATKTIFSADEMLELEDSIKDKDKEIEKLEARITDLETQLTEC